MKKINNVLFDPARVTWMHYDSDKLKVRVHFEDGSDLYFDGSEATEVWREFDDEPGWREPP